MENMDDVTKLYRACRPDEVLPADDERYVDCDDARGSRVAPLMARAFQLADPSRPEYKLFTGHRGVGKSTELLRLRQLLEQPAPGYLPFQVIYFDVVKHLDIADLEMPDLLVLTAAEVQRQLQEAKLPGFSVVTTLFQGIWDQIRQLTKAEISLSEAEVDVVPGFAKVTAELKNGAPSSRQALRAAIDKQSVSLRRALNDLLDAANAQLCQQGKAGLLLIIDSLEKLPLDRQERIFVERCDQLVGLSCHAVYTMPISMAYSPRMSETTQTFGEICVPVPMIRVAHDPQKTGVLALEKMIAKRCDYAHVDPAKVFDAPATREHLCRLSGGHPRHLMMFLQASLSQVDALPLKKTHVDKAVESYAQSLAREIPAECWPWLRRFKDGPLQSLPEDLPDNLRRSMLYWLYIFEYRNEEPFYDVNPVIRLLKRFKEKQSRPPSS